MARWRGLRQPHSLCKSDVININGHEDIITLNEYSNDISVLLGNGDGTFQPAMSFPAGINLTGLTVADFNGDGREDVAVADGGESDGEWAGVSILLGNGDGTFQSPIFFSAGAYPSSIVAGDFTGSGVMDLAVANSDSDDVSILMGNGHGGFVTLPPIPLGDQTGEPVSITAGDFWGNGALDLAVADQSSDSVSVLQGNGHGGFVVLPPISLGDDPLNFPVAIVSGDFTQAQGAQLAVLSDSFDELANVSILQAGAKGTLDLLPTIDLATALFPSSITTGNFFGDGALDLAISDPASSSVTLLQGDGQGGFQAASPLELGTGTNPTVVTTGDYNGDGLADLAVATQSPNNVVIELNQGNGQFTQPSAVGIVPRNTPVVADWTGDGIPEVAIVDGAGDILFRQGQPGDPGSFQSPVTVNLGRPSRDIAAVVTDQGTLLASVDATDNAVSLFAYRNGSFGFLYSLPTGLEPAQIVSADLLASGGIDLVIRNAGDGTLTVYLSNGNGGFQSPETLMVGPDISDVAAADVNQDGLLDLLLANQTAGEVEVLLNQGAAGFPPLRCTAPASASRRRSMEWAARRRRSTARTKPSASPHSQHPADRPICWRSTPVPTRSAFSPAWGAGGSQTRPRWRRQDQPWRFASPTLPETARPTWRSSARTDFPSGLATDKGGSPSWRAMTLGPTRPGCRSLT